MTVVRDGSMTRDRSRVVTEFLGANPGITTEKSPGYAPELDPGEGVRTCAKYGRMPNFAPRDTGHLRRKLGCELRRPKGRPDLLASFIEHSEFPLAM